MPDVPDSLVAFNAAFVSSRRSLRMNLVPSICRFILIRLPPDADGKRVRITIRSRDRVAGE